MTYEELHKKVGLALVRRGRSLEQVSEMAHRVLWRAACALNNAQRSAHWDVLWGFVERKGDLVIFKGGKPLKEQEIREKEERRTRLLFRRFLPARDRRVLKKAAVTFDMVLEGLQSGAG